MQWPLLVAAAAASVVPLHRPAHPLSFLARRETVAEFKARRNNTHATEYYGTVTVGGQDLRVLFDTGSDALLVPGAGCVSEACKVHGHYDPARSHTANQSASEPRAVAFGTGTAAGLEVEDVVCVGESCARATFLEVVEESDDPFLHAGFDGVMGLSLPLRKNATTRASVMSALVADHALPAPVFAAVLGGPSPHMEFGVEPRSWPAVWAPVSEPGYWQLSLAAISVGGKDLEVCHAASVGANITTFFGKMCCRDVEEFEREERCQYSAGAKRSRYASEGSVLATFEDGRVAVRMEDGCVQKVPAVWVSTLEGCRGDGTIQAVVDTGMSLLTAPPRLAKHLLLALGVPENCTGREDFPDLALRLPSGETLALSPDQYMDRVELADGSFCWAHVMPMPATAKGPVVVLGLPFLRAYSTVFDAEQQRLGFVRYAAPEATASPAPRKDSKEAMVRLHGRRGSQDA